MKRRASADWLGLWYEVAEFYGFYTSVQAFIRPHRTTLIILKMLSLVATPIGNLEDITLRALRILKECDVIAAEDTRRTGQLLHHFGITKPMISYFRFNEARRSEEILDRLGRGEKVVLVTDAGTPGISDPGQRVVEAAIQRGFAVESIPGPCALVAALTASGLPTDEFHFIGFLPRKPGPRRKRLEAVSGSGGTLVIYESPWRVGKILEEINSLWPQRKVVLAREITKKFEEYLRGTAAELLVLLPTRVVKGEFVVLVGPLEEPEAREVDEEDEIPH
jgi:16S rRNA (cytidine1402-2'-O)-methyltransferase